MQAPRVDAGRKWAKIPARMPTHAAIVVAFLLVTLVHAVVMGVTLRVQLWTWLGAQYFAAGQYVLFGLSAAFLSALLGRLEARLQRYVLLQLLVIASVVLRYALDDDVSGPAQRVSSWLPDLAVYWLSGLSGALALVGAFLMGRGLSGSILRWSAFAVAAGIASVNAVAFPLSYPGIHACAALAATSLLAGVLADRGYPESDIRMPWLLGAAGAVFASPALWVVPPNSVLLALLRQPAALFVPAIIQWRTPLAGKTRIPAASRMWFVDRSEFPPIPPTSPPLPTKIKRVILLGVDSMRADLLENEEFRERLPEFFRLRDESVWFENARSPGSSTAPSLAAMFAGEHYSQLYWSLHKRRRPETFPHEDHTPRFPELLTKEGVLTSTVDTTGWLTNTFGIVRGFTVESKARRGRAYASAQEAAGFLKAQLQEHMNDETARQFAFVHFIDAHAPYTSAGRFKKPFDGYIAELGLVDRQLGSLRRYLAKNQRSEETVIVVFSDHGEAFGENGLTQHASSLYDSMIRVPLLIFVPGLPARRVDTSVTLLDLGPTILDLFSLPTPPHFMGESLVEPLRGGPPRFTRPILAEARLKRALIVEDVKLILDTRTGAVEMFDLEQDPGETRNLYQNGDGPGEELRAVLSAFFVQHTHTRPGYTVPYRKW